MHHTDDTIDVILGYGPLGLVRATTRDIHPDGMIVDTGPVALARNAQVEVHLTLTTAHNKRPQNCRLTAQVVDSTGNGACLHFHPYDEIILSGLKGLPQAH